MLIQCSTMGCSSLAESKLDLKTNEVICEKCGKPIANLTSYTKKLLIDIGQVLRSNTKEPFQTFCKNCNANRSLYIDEGGQAFCRICNTKIEVTAVFLTALKEHLKDKDL